MSDSIDINERVSIPAADLAWEFSRSGGPGGQHVNTTDTRVRLRFDLENSEALLPSVKRRLRETYPSAVTSEGELLVVCDTHRSRLRNVEEAKERLAEMVRGCLLPPKRRVKTKPSKASKRRRIEGKKRRGAVKESRKKPDY